ncbi:MAG TPA: MFS transporter [Streptomyces sp.]|nr:MFS transporter [Streptomyces sp.]
MASEEHRSTATTTTPQTTTATTTSTAPASGTGSDAAGGSPARAWRTRLLVVALVLAAVNLRPAITSFGALLEEVRGGLGMSGSVAGLLTSVPPLCFALFGATAPRLARRFGPAAVVCAGMAAIAAGLLIRPYTGGTPAFLAASALALMGIAVSNVLMPVVVKRWFPDRVGPMTGVYSMALAVGTSSAAAVTVPAADALGGNWRSGLAVWAVPAALAVLPWLAFVRDRDTPRGERPAAGARGRGRPFAAWRDRRTDAAPGTGTAMDAGTGAGTDAAANPATGAGTSANPAAGAGTSANPGAGTGSAGSTSAPTGPATGPTAATGAGAGNGAAAGSGMGTGEATGAVAGTSAAGEPPAPSITRSPTARALAVFFGLQATAAYITMGWMPQIFRDAGVPADTAGLLLALTMVVGVPLAFVIPRLAARMPNQGPIALALGACGLAGYAGLYLAPAAGALAWALLLGVSNCAFPLALTMVGMRARTGPGVARLSAFAQSTGYLLSIPGPLLVGVLYQHSGGWGLPIALMTALMIPQMLVGVLAGRNRTVEDETTG